MDVKTNLKLEDLMESIERIYKKHGNIGVAIRVTESQLAPVRQIGVAGKDSKNRTVDNMYMCFSTFILEDTFNSKDKE